MKTSLVLLALALSVNAFAASEIVCERIVYIDGSETRDSGKINKRLKELQSIVKVTHLSTAITQTRTGQVETRCVALEL